MTSDTLDIVSIIISLISLFVSGYIWYSDKKSVWYWNIVIVPLQEIFKSLKAIDVNDKKNIVTNLNRYNRSMKDCSDFLEISISNKKITDLKEFIENQFNRITIAIMTNENGGNYMELISSFETQVYKKIAKLVLKK